MDDKNKCTKMTFSEKIRNLLMSKSIYAHFKRTYILHDETSTENQNSGSLLNNEISEQTAEEEIVEEEIAEEEQSTKYKFKDYVILMMILLVLLFVFGLILHSFFNNFFYKAMNLVSGIPGMIFKLPCSRKLKKLLSYGEFAQKIEEFLKRLTFCLKAKIFETPLKWFTALLRNVFFSSLFYYAIYFPLFYNFNADGSEEIRSHILTAFVSFLL